MGIVTVSYAHSKGLNGVSMLMSATMMTMTDNDGKKKICFSDDDVDPASQAFE